MTQLIKAAEGKITKQMKIAAEQEKVTAEYIRKHIADGSIVIPYNKKHLSLKSLCAIGKGLRTKVNANIGTSSEHSNLGEELKKLKTAVEADTDTIMAFRTGGEVG